MAPAHVENLYYCTLEASDHNIIFLQPIAAYDHIDLK